MTRRVAGATAANAGFGVLFTWSVLVEPAAADLGVDAAQLSVVWAAALISFSAGVLCAGPALRLLGAPWLLVTTGLCAAPAEGSRWG